MISDAPNMEALVAAVKAHAVEHYNDGGWDVIVECWEDQQIADLLTRDAAYTTEAAIAAFGPVVDVWADRQADAQFHRDQAIGPPCRCHCGYRASSGDDLDEHVEALISVVDGVHHGKAS